MRVLKVVLIIVLFIQYGIGQKATFELPLYFEDAKGNKDSIIIGYDTKADDNNLSLNLGEDILTTPFDSVFEVRVAKTSDYWSNTEQNGKKRICKPEGSNNCYLFGFLYIVINAKYNPVKITYDAKKLNISDNFCLQNTILAKTQEVRLKESGWYDAKDWVCMASQNELFIDMSKKDGSHDWLERSYLIKGKTATTPIHALEFLNSTIGPCEYYTKTEEVRIENILFYPNPVSTNISFNLEADFAFHNDLYLEIFDVNGRLQQRNILNKDTRQQVETSDLHAGFYFAKISDSNRTYFSTRFVKVE